MYIPIFLPIFVDTRYMESLYMQNFTTKAFLVSQDLVLLMKGKKSEYLNIAQKIWIENIRIILSDFESEYLVQYQIIDTVVIDSISSIFLDVLRKYDECCRDSGYRIKTDTVRDMYSHYLVVKRLIYQNVNIRYNFVRMAIKKRKAAILRGFDVFVGKSIFCNSYDDFTFDLIQSLYNKINDALDSIQSLFLDIENKVQELETYIERSKKRIFGLVSSSNVSSSSLQPVFFYSEDIVSEFLAYCNIKIDEIYEVLRRAKNERADGYIIDRKLLFIRFLNWVVFLNMRACNRLLDTLL